MSEFSLGASLSLTGFDLKNNRRQIFGWSIAMFAIMFLYMILFSSMQEMAKAKLDAMPKELLQFFNMESVTDLSNFITYFGMIYNLILIAISIFAATFSANLIYREEKSKTIEFLYSLELSRTEIYASKLITAFTAVLAVTASAIVSSAICGAINGGDTFVLEDFIKIVKVSSFCAFFFMSVSLLIGGITTKVGVSTCGSMAVLLCFMLGYLSKLLETKAQWLEYLSPFILFNYEKAISLKSTTMTALGIYFMLMLAFLLVGGIAYKHRDFNI